MGEERNDTPARPVDGTRWIGDFALQAALDDAEAVRLGLKVVRDRLEDGLGDVEAICLELRAARNRLKHHAARAQVEVKERALDLAGDQVGGALHLDAEVTHLEAEYGALAAARNQTEAELEAARRQLKEVLSELAAARAALMAVGHELGDQDPSRPEQRAELTDDDIPF